MYRNIIKFSVVCIKGLFGGKQYEKLGIDRFKFVLWLTILNMLMIKEFLFPRGIRIDGARMFCSAFVLDTYMHLLFFNVL